MNEWVERSIEIANAPGYLDRLHEVYPVVQETERELTADVKTKLTQLYEEGSPVELVRFLLNLKNKKKGAEESPLPIKDPYVAFLGKKRGTFLEGNPVTVNRIATTIRSIGFEATIEALQEPKEFNRQIGALFSRWLPKLGYPLLGEPDFESHSGIALLLGSNARLKDYANTRLDCDLEKGPDLLAKVGDKYVIGEAKFLTDYGGHQNAQFEDALRLLRGKTGQAIRIAVLDGVVRIKAKTVMFRTVSQLEDVTLTALLLRDFLESLRDLGS